MVGPPSLSNRPPAMVGRSLRTLITAFLLISAASFFLVVVFSSYASHRLPQHDLNPPLGSVNPRWGPVQLLSDVDHQKLTVIDVNQTAIAKPKQTDKQIYSNERQLLQNSKGFSSMETKYYEQYYLRRQNISSPTLHSPVFSSSRCQDPLCLHLVSVEERAQFDECMESTIRKKLGPGKNGSCHFMSGSGRPTVALSSFPGSGNTWMRGLLELTTGICTGSIYCDRHLRNEGFTGEGMIGSSVIAVKIHKPSPPQVKLCFQDRCYSSLPAIVLIRNPRNALIANYNRKSSGHVGVLGSNAFGYNKVWMDYVSNSINHWIQHTFKWLNASKTVPTVLVRFENLQTQTVMEMKRVLDFLGVEPELTVEQLEDRLSEGFEQFHRKKPGVNIQYFTPSQDKLVKEAVNETVALLRKNDLDESFITAIEDYL